MKTEKKCRICKGIFSAKNSTQVVCCMQCAIKLADQKKQNQIRQDQKKWNAEKKIIKEKLLTPSDRRNNLQKIFNEWIRLRDKDFPCISCGRDMKGKKAHAGHFYSVGRFPELRFDPDNCHVQCEWCNVFLHGNGALYRLNLVDRIGKKRLDLLDQRAGVPKNLMTHEISELMEYYKLRVKEEKSKK